MSKRKIYAALSMLENSDIRESERKRIRDMAWHNWSGTITAWQWWEGEAPQSQTEDSQGKPYWTHHWADKQSNYARVQVSIYLKLTGKIPFPGHWTRAVTWKHFGRFHWVRSQLDGSGSQDLTMHGVLWETRAVSSESKSEEKLSQNRGELQEGRLSQAIC